MFSLTVELRVLTRLVQKIFFELVKYVNTRDFTIDTQEHAEII
jgi:hypothetical protein